MTDEGTPINPFLGEYPPIDADPKLIGKFLSTGLASPSELRGLKPEVLDQLKSEKYIPASLNTVGEDLFSIADMARHSKLAGRVEVMTISKVRELTAAYGAEGELRKRFLEEYGFCSDQEGEAAVQVLAQLALQGERDVNPSQLWQQIKSDLSQRDNSDIAENKARTRELMGRYTYVLDTPPGKDSPVAYAWPYIGFRRFPYFESIPDGAETQAKNALKAVGGKPWRVTVRQMTPGGMNKTETLFVFVGK